MEPTVKRRNNALTQAQASELRGWLENNRVKVSPITARQGAELATYSLGFVVTPSNVLFHKRGLGIVKPKPVAPAAECRCKDLARELVWLCDHLAVEPSAILLDMAGIIRRRAAATEPLPFTGTMGAR